MMARALPPARRRAVLPDAFYNARRPQGAIT